ncbi:MAG: hypothetical protein CMK00_01460 [Planctomycetes bacterium]|nr:hypothetical protein [Planctomycetota bacterium]
MSCLPPIHGRPVTVMGLGLFGGGAAVARYLARAGGQVTVTDLRPAEVLAPALAELAGLDISWHLGGHREDDFTDAALVVANPAVPPDSPFLTAARGAEVPITSELALFLPACRATLALVTGTQGKSSTCQFLADLLGAAPLAGTVHLGGNIGRSLLDELPLLGERDVVVLEVSSYQLAALSPGECRAIRAAGRVRAVAITNILEDHLERHGSPEAYAAAKARVLELLAPDGTALLPARDSRLGTDAPEARRGGARRPSDLEASPAGSPRETIAFGRGRAGESFPRLRLAEGELYDGETRLGNAGDLPLRGLFQADNLLLAAGLARVLGLAPETIAGAISGLRGLPHRMEPLEPDGTPRRPYSPQTRSNSPTPESADRPGPTGAGNAAESTAGPGATGAGPLVIDNGVSTTPDSTLSALRSCSPPVILLLGGRDKGLSFDELIAAARGRVRLVLCFGEAAPSLATRFLEGGLETEIHRELTAATRAARSAAGPEDTLLFSPACSSFDAFNNFRDRAEAFRAALAPGTGQQPAPR